MAINTTTGSVAKGGTSVSPVDFIKDQLNMEEGGDQQVLPVGTPTQGGSGLVAEAVSFRADPTVDPSQDSSGLPSGLEQLDQGFQVGVLDPNDERFANPVERDPMEGRVRSLGEIRKDIKQSKGSDYGDSAFEKRFINFGKQVEAGNIGVNLAPNSAGPEAFNLSKSLSGPDLAGAMSSLFDGKKASLMQAISRSDALEQVESSTTKSGYRTVPNRVYSQVMGAVTEQFFANEAAGLSFEDDPFANESPTLLPSTESVKDNKVKIMTQAKNNKKLGQEIHLQYLRLLRDSEKANGVPETDPKFQQMSLNAPTKLDDYEAEVLGSAAKSIWADANPDLVYKPDIKAFDQTTYILTPKGEDALAMSAKYRNELFPKVEVKPLSAPKALVGTDIGKNYLRQASGYKKGMKFNNELEEAIHNLQQVANVVDSRRLKILLATSLPSLMGKGGKDFWGADINNVGNKKLDSFKAALMVQEQRIAAGTLARSSGEKYEPEKELEKIRRTLAQEINGLVEFRNKAFYLTYSVQGFQGRITPQQTYVNPTTAKSARFVTRSATPAIIKSGNRQERNLRQMYAMILLKAGDDALPPRRDALLEANKGILRAMGIRLREALTMTDAQLEAVSTAIENKVPLTSPQFPKFNGLNLDPNNEADAKIIRQIQSKKEDGNLFIDTIIDFANYMDYKDRPNGDGQFLSSVNAYMDGKTNGPASNAMQLGDKRTAFFTGVMRTQDEKLLDSGDLRDSLIGLASQSIIDKPFNLEDDLREPAETVAKEVFKYRELAKLVIMTWGYGKELTSFGPLIEEVVALITAEKQRVLSEGPSKNSMKDIDAAHDYLSALDTIDGLDYTDESVGSMAKVREQMLTKYSESVKSTLANGAMEARSLMRAVAAETAIMNLPFVFQTPSGMVTHVGGMASLGSEGADRSSFTTVNPNTGKLRSPTEVIHYESESTAAAERIRNDVAIPGEYAYGGAPVVPIQGIDAAVVTRTSSGKSWSALEKTPGAPYLHTIYDAFKVDANGYDTILREVNTNWMDITIGTDKDKGWSYLEEALRSLKESNRMFDKALQGRSDDDVLTTNERALMDWLLTGDLKRSPDPRTGEWAERIVIPNFKNRISKYNQLLNQRAGNGVSDDTAYISDIVIDRMSKVGYDVLSPPQSPTVKHLKEFRNLLRTHLNTISRLEKSIAETNKNKKELRREMMNSGMMYTDPEGNTFPLQYYAH